MKEIDTWAERWALANAWQKTVNVAVRRFGLTGSQYLVLRALDRLERQTGDAVKQRDVVEATQLGESTISHTFKKLEGLDLVDRGIHGIDARQWRIIVTSKGRKLLKHAEPIVEDLTRRRV